MNDVNDRDTMQSMDRLDGAATARWMRLYAAALAEHEGELTALDAAIGDGDHGTNMARGFAAVERKLPGLEEQAPAAILKVVASTLISTVGGASGPLYGTAFLRAAAAVPGDAALTLTDLATALEAAQAGIAARGKATRGEKTMLDAFGPAVDALRRAVETGASLPVATRDAAAAAQAGAEATIPMLASKGRASYLGPRSQGHQDPGATSTALLFAALARAAGAE